MTQLEGIKNFARNIKLSMVKIREGKELTSSELQSILQFYLEVLDYLSKAEAEFELRRGW